MFIRLSPTPMMSLILNLRISYKSTYTKLLWFFSSIKAIHRLYLSSKEKRRTVEKDHRVENRKKFSNGTHSKMPPFLGAISVFVCFMAAAVSFALAFILVLCLPCQVKPWTGFMLIYEWTFTTFLIIFGRYLCAIHQWGTATSNQKGTTTSSFEDDLGKGVGHQHSTSNRDTVAWFFWIGMAFPGF